MKTRHYCITALVLSVLSQVAFAGDAEITLKANQPTQEPIKYGPVITIKPKGVMTTSQAAETNTTTAPRTTPMKIANQPLRKIEPDEIDNK